MGRSIFAGPKILQPHHAYFTNVRITCPNKWHCYIISRFDWLSGLCRTNWLSKQNCVRIVGVF